MGEPTKRPIGRDQLGERPIGDTQPIGRRNLRVAIACQGVSRASPFCPRFVGVPGLSPRFVFSVGCGCPRFAFCGYPRFGSGLWVSPFWFCSPRFAVLRCFRFVLRCVLLCPFCENGPWCAQVANLTFKRREKRWEFSSFLWFLRRRLRMIKVQICETQYRQVFQ